MLVNKGVCVELVDQFIDVMGVDFIEQGGDWVYYLLSDDVVCMFWFEQFCSMDYFYVIVFYELSYWIGYKMCLDWDFFGWFGLCFYVVEELVVELFVVFLCVEFGFDGDLWYVVYIKSWISFLKDDSWVFIMVVSKV